MSLHQYPHLFSWLTRAVSCMGDIPIVFNSNKSKEASVRHVGTITHLKRDVTNTMVIIFILQVFLKKADPMEGFLAFIGLSFILVCQASAVEQRKKGKDMVLFFNELIHFDKKYPSAVKQRQTFTIIGIYIMAHCLIVTSHALPAGFVHGLHWFRPCKMSLVGYWIIPECHGITVQDGFPLLIRHLPKVAVIMLNHWFWSMLIPAGTLSVGVLHAMSVESIHQFIER